MLQQPAHRRGITLPDLLSADVPAAGDDATSAREYLADGLARGEDPRIQRGIIAPTREGGVLIVES